LKKISEAMVTDVCPMVAEKSSVANAHKVANIDEKSENWEKEGLATLLLMMNYPILWYYR
jgi:hypothetical protein